MQHTEMSFEPRPQEIKQYVGKWIAVLNSKIIANGKDIEKVYACALEITNESVLFMYVHENHETLIL